MIKVNLKVKWLDQDISVDLPAIPAVGTRIVHKEVERCGLGRVYDIDGVVTDVESRTGPDTNPRYTVWVECRRRAKTEPRYWTGAEDIDADVWIWIAEGWVEYDFINRGDIFVPGSEPEPTETPSGPIYPCAKVDW